MTAIANGLDLHGGFIAYAGTFLVFSDYARNAVRMSALIPTGAIHVYTHDSIGLGEDGPTHQPVEHLAALRMIPGLEVWRPADKTETAAAWRAALVRRDGPTALVLTRQGVDHQPRPDAQIGNIERGGYVLKDGGERPDAIIIATGSEVELAVSAAERLAAESVRVRVVSIPNPVRFEAQDAGYRASVLPADIPVRVAVEAGVTHYWRAVAGAHGRVIGIDTFGASAPAGDLFEHFGLTPERVAVAVREAIAAANGD